MKRFWPFLILLFAAPLAIAGAAFRGIDKAPDGGTILRFSTGDIALPQLARGFGGYGLVVGNGNTVPAVTSPALTLAVGATSTGGSNYIRIGANNSTTAISFSDIRSSGGLAMGTNAESKSQASDSWGLINTGQNGAVLTSSPAIPIFVGSNTSALLGATTAALQPSVNSSASAFPMLFKVDATTGTASFSNGANSAKTVTTGLQLVSTASYTGASDVIPAIYNNVASSDGVATTQRVQFAAQWNTSNVWGIGTDGSTAPSIVIGAFTPSTGKVSAPFLTMLSGPSNNPIGGLVSIGNGSTPSTPLSYGNVSTFSVAHWSGTNASTQTCTTICGNPPVGINSGSGQCLAAWTSALAASTCATSAAGQRCLCTGVKA